MGAMRTFAGAFVLACVLSAVLTPLVRKMALRHGAVSIPGGRHIHTRTIPRLGGIAIFLGLIAPLIGLFFVEGAVASMVRAEQRHVWGLLLGGTIMGLVGLVDDTRGLPARHKFYAQLGAGALAF